MRPKQIVFGSLLLISLGAGAPAQQHLTQTVTKQNTNCNSTCSVIDLPELNGNPAAVIFITPIGNTKYLNPHPIGAYYMYLKKWSVFNLDSTTITEGSKFDIEYYAFPDADRFVFIVPQRRRSTDPAYIDRAGLNYNPTANVRILPTNPPGRGALFDRGDVKVEYDPLVFKWFIAHTDGTPVPAESAFNVAVSGLMGIANVQPTPVPGGVPVVPTQMPANTVTPPGPVRGGLPPVSIGGVQPAQTPIVPLIGPPTPPAPIGGVQPAQTPTVPVRGPPTPPAAHVNWVLFDDEQPSIPPNSDILLFVHGMDSRAEEADDITNALFALKANPGGAPPAPSVSNAQMISDLNRLLHKYEGCILEKYETQQDMSDRGLSPNLSGLWTTNGLQARDSIACVAGNICSRAFRQSTFTALQAQANDGNATNFEANLKKAIPADCFECAKHAEMHTKHVHCTMEAGGNNGTAGPVFEGCKAGVDIAALVTRIINDVHAALTGAGGGSHTGGPTVASNYSTVQFNSCAIPSQGCPEACDHPDDFSHGARAASTPFEVVNGQPVPLYFSGMVPPSMLDTVPPNLQINVPVGHNIGANEGRLGLDLRAAAVQHDPLKTLGIATYRYANGDAVSGQAFADLSVTGRNTFEVFRHALPKEPFCQSLLDHRQPQLSDATVLDGCHKALDRAYRVANFLRTGQRGDTPALKAKKAAERQALGWIAVSGEDDQPHRPVNVPSSDYPQYDIPVTVPAPFSALPTKTVTLQARYVIAQSQTANPGGRNLVMISFDLPSSGYTTNIDFNRVSTLNEIGHPKPTNLPIPIPIPLDIYSIIAMHFASVGYAPPGPVLEANIPIPDFESTGRTPVLDFDEDFIVKLADAINQKTPIESSVKAVMGGSLGGNMTFRLGRRPNVDWLPKFIVWSPASIWFSLGEGNDILKHIGPRKAWESANKAVLSPADRDRAEFFGGWDKPIVPLIIPMAQSDTWTSDYYSCKKTSIAGARLDRQETYDHWFLAWHWRLGGEQLLYSHQTTDPVTHLPRYMSNRKPMLLGCGVEDRVPFNDICPATQSTAQRMSVTPGKAVFLDKTGHSLDNERRMFWAQQIIDFLK